MATTHKRKEDFTNESTFAALDRASERARYASNTIAAAKKAWLIFRDEQAVQALAVAITILAEASSEAAEALRDIAPKKG